jgi:hypothetical protein
MPIQKVSKLNRRWAAILIALALVLMMSLIVVLTYLVYMLRAPLHYAQLVKEGYDDLVITFLLTLISHVMNSLWTTKGVVSLMKVANPRTSDEFEIICMWSTYMFKFVSTYFGSIYLGLLESFVPNAFKPCSEDFSCMQRLSERVAFTMFMSIVIGNTQEYVWPIFNRCIKARQSSTMEKHLYEMTYSQAEKEWVLSQYRQADDYSEIALQHGWVVLFAGVCPAAASIAFLNNVFETFLDASRLIHWCKRPVVLPPPARNPYADLLRLNGAYQI